MGSSPEAWQLEGCKQLPSSEPLSPLVNFRLPPVVADIQPVLAMLHPKGFSLHGLDQAHMSGSGRT